MWENIKSETHQREIDNSENRKTKKDKVFF